MKSLIFTYVLTYVGAAAALFNPFVGLLIYVCFAIVKPDQIWSWSVPVGNHSRIVAIAVLFGWAFRGFGNWSLGRATAIVGAFIGFWVWSSLSAMLVATDSKVAWGFVESVAKVLLPFLVGITIVDNHLKVKQLTWVVVLSQGYIAYEINRLYFDGFSYTFQHYGFAGMDNNCISIAMVTGSGLAFFLGLASTRWWQRALAMLSALLMVHCILFSLSRGGMLALVITGVVSFCLLPKRPIYISVFALAAIAALQLAGPEVRQRFALAFSDEQERDASAASRLAMWQNCLDIMKDRPMLGLGPRHWPLIAHTYGWPEGKEAHSLWLQLGSEVGVPGLSFLMLFYVVCIWRMFPFTTFRSEQNDPWIANVARGVVTSLCGFALSAQFVSLYGLEIPFYVVLIGGCILKLSQPERDKSSQTAWNMSGVALSNFMPMGSPNVRSI